MRIAIDAMGGDNAPDAAIKAAQRVAGKYPNDEFLLFGNEEQLTVKLGDTKAANIVIVPTTEVIETGDEPTKAVRRKKDSSLVRAARAVRQGEADALVSAGNTGALLTVATIIIGRIRGVDRAAILVDVPNLKKPGQTFAYIDAGANAEVKPKYLHQYALMASRYASDVKGIDNPRVGLLNNGAEEEKGSPVTKETYQLLKNEPAIQFIGNVEARDILNDPADILVTDGFTGNAVLKTVEGVAMTLLDILKTAIKDGGVRAKMGGALLYKSIKQQLSGIDASTLSGGLFFGVKQPVIKAHGNATENELSMAIEQAISIVESRLYERLGELLKQQKEEAKSTDD
ncbi:MAG: phosphate acyltransferase PlsX [Aerococcus sp.]|nr:phosphate acyltransferase PlsX [Aerococcus sp.]